jgi:hypothetical protein
MKYRTKEIISNIFAVVVPNDYERAMLFCRAQEFYESPSKKFRDNTFSIWDYFRWYSSGKGCFSYPRDFVGFNLPLIVAKKCYELNEIETPYDKVMKGIIDGLFVNGTRQYLIGVDSLENTTFDHEMAHALYYTDISYKSEMDEITLSISDSDMGKFKRNLKQIGYCSAVVKDEIQAYMATEISKKAARGVVNKKKLHQKYRSVFKRYKF